MSFFSSISSVVSKVLPKVASVVGNIASSPAGKVGIDILKQLASSAFSKDGKGGLFSDSFKLTLPNPLSKLNGLLGSAGKNVTSIGDFLSKIGDFLQGKRQLENGTNVTVPQLNDRSAVSAQAAASTAQAIASGQYNSTIAQTVASSSAASTSAASNAPGVLSGIDPIAFNTGLTKDQTDLLANVTDPTQKAQMTAQFKMQNYQNLMQFISNIMRIQGDISKSIISNIR